MHTPISYNNLPRHDTTLLDSKRQKINIKIKIPGTPPSFEQAKGMPLQKEISLLILVDVHVVLGEALPWKGFSSLI